MTPQPTEKTIKVRPANGNMLAATWHWYWMHINARWN